MTRELSLSLPRFRVRHEVRPSGQQLFHTEQRERTQQGPGTLGAGGCLPSAPCQPDPKAESTEIPPALPGLGCRLRAEAIALCARRGPGGAEPTAGADAQWPREAAGAAARSGSLQASRARKQTPRPQRHRFGSEPHN